MNPSPPGTPIKRFTLRTIFAYFAAVSVFATAAAVGTVGFIHARSTVEGLATQVFEMEAEYTNARVVEYSSSARHILDLNASLLGDNLIDASDLRALGNHLIDVLDANPRLSSSGFGSPNGEAMWVTSDPNGEIQVHSFRFNESNQMVQKSFIAHSPSEWELQVEQNSDYRGHVRPWYKAALTASDHSAVWTEPYLFIPEYIPGISLSRQVLNPEGQLLGVTFVDFEFRFLSRALEELQIGRPGAQSIVFDEEGTVLAHTNPDSTSQHDEDGERQLIKLDAHNDPVVRRLASDLGLPESAATLENQGLQYIDLDGVSYVVVVRPARLIQESTQLAWNVATVVPESLVLKNVHQQGFYSIGVGIAIFLTFLVTAILLSRAATESIYGFFDEMQRLAALDLREPERSTTRISEVHSLGHNLDQMRAGLRSFGRYVSAALVRELISKGIEARPGGHDQEITLMFTDVVGFTTISERFAPQVLAEKLGSNLEVATQIVGNHQGTVDKYIGDSVMAFWNAPTPVPDHALQACHAALEIMARIDASAHSDEPLWPIRIGINTTVALVGNLGSSSRLDYTVIGDGVNLASRIEGINKEYGTRILIGESTKNAVEKTFLTRPIDHVVVKGQSRPEPIHELMTLRAHASDEQRQLAELTAKGLAHFLACEWEACEATYQQCLSVCPSDAPAQLFLKRCAQKRTADSDLAS